MSAAEPPLEFVLLDRRASTADEEAALSAFLDLGRAYVGEANWPPEEAGRFVRGIADALERPEYWMILLKRGGRFIGFCVAKTSADEDAGAIMEFYVAPEDRCHGYGRRLYERAADLMRKRSRCTVWLKTDGEAAPFWQALGFEETYETDEYTGQVTMERGL